MITLFDFVFKEGKDMKNLLNFLKKNKGIGAIIYFISKENKK